jgi:hypothetical protein
MKCGSAGIVGPNENSGVYGADNGREELTLQDLKARESKVVVEGTFSEKKDSRTRRLRKESWKERTIQSLGRCIVSGYGLRIYPAKIRTHRKTWEFDGWAAADNYSFDVINLSAWVAGNLGAVTGGYHVYYYAKEDWWAAERWDIWKKYCCVRWSDMSNIYMTEEEILSPDILPASVKRRVTKWFYERSLLVRSHSTTEYSYKDYVTGNIYFPPPEVGGEVRITAKPPHPLPVYPNYESKSPVEPGSEQPEPPEIGFPELPPHPDPLDEIHGASPRDIPPRAPEPQPGPVQAPRPPGAPPGRPPMPYMPQPGRGGGYKI